MQRRRQEQQRPPTRLRFYVFILLVLVAAGFGAWQLLKPTQRSTTAIVAQSTLGSQYTGEIVIVRNETLYAVEGATRVDFIADEGARVTKGSAICKVYSAGYSSTEISRLNSYRTKIQQYHKESVISKELDTQLEKLDELVDSYALQVRMLVQGEGNGSLNNVEKQLTSALSSRQSYLKQKYPDDQTLATLYDDESRQLKRIESWTTTYTASEECLVSFYTDGYESTINAQTFDAISIADAKAVMNGQTLEMDTVARGKESIFRTVRPDTWYAILVTGDKEWNPIVGQTYLMQLDGFDNYLVNAQVDSFARSGGELMVRLAVSSDVTPILSVRTCRVAIGESVTGMSVPNRALRVQEGMIGVVVSDLGMNTFIPVNVITYDDENAVVTPQISGSPLQVGKTVLLFD